MRDIVPQVSCPITSYGFDEDAQVRAVDVRAVGGQMHFTVQRRNGVTLPDLDVVLNLPGEHNVLNALSAIAVAVELNVPDAAVQKALADFKGVGRRFQRYGELPCARTAGSFTRDRRLRPPPGRDGGHAGGRARRLPGPPPGAGLPAAPLHAAPATASRTSSRSSATADAVLLAEVYAAGEAPIVAADGRSLARALRVAGKVEPVFVDDIAAMPQAIWTTRATATW